MKSSLLLSLAFGVLLSGLTSCETYVDGPYAVAHPHGFVRYYQPAPDTWGHRHYAVAHTPPDVFVRRYVSTRSSWGPIWTSPSYYSTRYVAPTRVHFSHY